MPFTIPITVELSKVTPLILIWVSEYKTGFYSSSPFGQGLGCGGEGDDFCHCLKWTESDSAFCKDGGHLGRVPAIPFAVGPPRFSGLFPGLQRVQGRPEPEIAQEGLRKPVLAVTHAVRDASPSVQATSRALRDYHVATA